MNKNTSRLRLLLQFFIIRESVHTYGISIFHNVGQVFSKTKNLVYLNKKIQFRAKLNKIYIETMVIMYNSFIKRFFYKNNLK